MLFILMAVAMVFPSCKKSSSYMNRATITGADAVLCSCCGGYFITIHGSTDQAAKFSTLPAGADINLATATFPINVYINWHRDLTSCNPDAVIIDAELKVNQ